VYLKPIIFTTLISPQKIRMLQILYYVCITSITQECIKLTNSESKDFYSSRKINLNIKVLFFLTFHSPKNPVYGT